MCFILINHINYKLKNWLKNRLEVHFEGMGTKPLVALDNTTLNHPLIYLNKCFDNVIGWSLEEIPDKNHWWKKAYPDPDYKKVAEDLWELSMESVSANNDNFAMVTVNIMTKHNGVKRFKIYTELKNALMDGYYVVAFKEID